jgi:hypothetical protein
VERESGGRGRVTMGSDGKTLRVIPSLAHFTLDEIRAKKLGTIIIIIIVVVVIIIIIIIIMLILGVGLAMTRSLGHTILSTCGVSAEPDFFTAALQYALFFVFFSISFSFSNN